jgi:hypothetical protein
VWDCCGVVVGGGAGGVGVGLVVLVGCWLLCASPHVSTVGVFFFLFLFSLGIQQVSQATCSGEVKDMLPMQHAHTHT